MNPMHLAGLLALASALCVAIGDVVQQRAAHRITDRPVGHIELLAKLLRDKWWWVGALVLIASIGLQAAALGQGSVLLVQPLLTFSLLFALPINARLSRRAVTGQEWVWAGLLTVAVAVIVTVGHPHEGRSGASLQMWVAVAAVLGPLLVGCVVVGRIRGGVVAAVLFAFVSGSLWGVFAVLAKEVVAHLGDGGWAVARTPALYACLLAVLGGLVWSQSAFRAGPLTASMPTLQVSQPVVAAVLGVVVLGETMNAGRVGMIGLVVAALAMTTAIVQLARVEAIAARLGVEEKTRRHRALTRLTR